MPNSEACQVNIANSIWFRDRDSLAINEDFLKTSRNYYDASIFEAPFDAGTKDDINSWVKKETNGMIQKRRRPGTRLCIWSMRCPLTGNGGISIKRTRYIKEHLTRKTGNTSPRSSCIPQKQSILKIHGGGVS